MDKTIPVRMLLYILQLYDLMFRNSRKGKLPAVFPILLYTGRDTWTVPENVAALIEDTIPGKYIPSFHYYPVIERDIADETLKRIRGLVSAVMYLEKRGSEVELTAAIDDVIDLIAEERGEELRMFGAWLNGMFGSVLGREQILSITDVKEVRSMLAELAQQIEKRGERRGVKRGVKREKIETAKRMLAAGMDEATVVQLAGLPAADVAGIVGGDEASTPQ